MRKSRRAVSPVIATVILVAIAITVAAVFAYWVGSIEGGRREPKEGTYQIGDRITGSYFYQGVVGSDTIVIGYGDRSYFLPVSSDQQCHVPPDLYVRILKFNPETFELTLSWTRRSEIK